LWAGIDQLALKNRSERCGRQGSSPSIALLCSITHCLANPTVLSLNPHIYPPESQIE